MKTKINRKFIEEMMRLKRNVINFHDMRIKFPLSLQLNNKTFIGYSFESKNWTIKSSKLNSDNWNPKLVEIVTFLNNFSEQEILLAIKKMEEISINGYKNVNAIMAKTKFQYLLDLMKLDENQIQPLIKIVIKDENTIYEIAFVELNDSGNKTFVYSVELLKEKVSTPWIHFDEKQFHFILKNISYYNIMTALNKTYKQLLKKNFVIEEKPEYV